MPKRKSTKKSIRKTSKKGSRKASKKPTRKVSKKGSVKRKKSTTKKTKRKSTKKKKKTSGKKKKSTKKKRKSTKKKTTNKKRRKTSGKNKTNKKSKSEKKKKPKPRNITHTKGPAPSFEKMTDLMVLKKIEDLKETDAASRKEIMKSELKLIRELPDEKRKESINKFNNAYKHTKTRKWVTLTVYVNVYEYHSASTEFTDQIVDLYLENGMNVKLLEEVADYAKKMDEFILYGLIKEKLKKQQNGSGVISVFDKPEVPTNSQIAGSASDIEKEIDSIIGANDITENIAVDGVVGGDGQHNEMIVSQIPGTETLQNAGMDAYLEKLENHKIDTAIAEHYGGKPSPLDIPLPSENPSALNTPIYGGQPNGTPDGINGISNGTNGINNNGIPNGNMGGSNNVPVDILGPIPGYGGGEEEPDIFEYNSVPDHVGGKEDKEEEPTDQEYYTDKAKVILEEYENKSYDTLERKEEELSIEEMGEFISELIKYGIDKDILRDYWRTLPLKQYELQNLIINNPDIYPR